jgi:hypothetical protein
MNEKCSTKGCENEIEFVENFFGIEYCQECERLLMLASKNKIDVSLCKDKKELLEMLKDKN